MSAKTPSVEIRKLMATGIAAAFDIFVYRTDTHKLSEIDGTNYWGNAAYNLRTDDLIWVFDAEAQWGLYRVADSDTKTNRVYVEKAMVGAFKPVENEDGYTIRWGGKRGGQFQIVKDGKAIKSDFKTREDAARELERIRLGIVEAA